MNLGKMSSYDHLYYYNAFNEKVVAEQIRASLLYVVILIWIL